LGTIVGEDLVLGSLERMVAFPLASLGYLEEWSSLGISLVACSVQPCMVEELQLLEEQGRIEEEPLVGLVEEQELLVLVPPLE